MNNSSDLKQALDEVSASSAGGAPFLTAYAVTFFITAILSFFLPLQPVALIAMFQGIAALPLAFWLERRMGTRRMSRDNPLQQLSVLMAVSQSLAIPAFIVVYSLNPLYIPVVLAGVGGMHFLPYAWLHRTRLYIFLGTIVALGAFAIQLALQGQAFVFVLFFVAIAYAIGALLVYRNAKKAL